MSHAEQPELSIVMPVYQEADSIGRTLEQLEAASGQLPSCEIVIVYDFEEDNTLPVVRSWSGRLPQLRLLHNQLGRGVINALKAGLRDARGRYVLVMMADGSDRATDIPEMVELARNGAVVIAASRYMPGGQQIGGPLVKRTLSRLAGLSLHWLARLPMHDATSNFRLYRKDFLDRVTIESEAGFELALELTVKAHRMRLQLAEVPTVWRDRTAGQSNFRLWHWLPHYLRWYLSAFAPRPRQRTPIAD